MTTTATAYTHMGLTSGSVYEYEIVTTDSVGNTSAPITDYAMTHLFTDQPLQAGVTSVRGVHIGELRQAADIWRVFAGVSAAFGSYEAAIGLVAASHLNEVVAAINGARTQVGLPAFSYSGVPAPAQGSVIDRRHVQQLRESMR